MSKVGKPMAFFGQVEAHLSGVQKLLSSLQGQPCLAQVAKGQCDSILLCLKGGCLTMHQAAQLNTLVTNTDWPGSLSAQLLEAIASRTSTTPSVSANARTGMQAWESLFNYYTMQQWHCLSDLRIADSSKLDIVLDIAVGLGLRWPSEPTVQLMTTLWRLACDGPDQVKLLPWDIKLGYVRQVKAVWKRKIANIPPPDHYFDVLPATSDAFKQDFPGAFAALYGSSEPVACPVPEAYLRELQDTFPMRSTKKAPPSAPTSQGDVFAAAFAQVMQVLNNGGLRNNGGAASSSSGDGLRIQLLSPRQSERPHAEPLALAAPSAEVGAGVAAPTAVAGSSPPAGVAVPTEAPARSSALFEKAFCLPVKPGKKGADPPSVEDITKDILAGMAEKATESSAKGKAKSKGKAKAKGKAAPKPKAKSKAKAKAAPILKLGCSKCRYARNGCSECKKRLAKAAKA